MLFRSNMFEGLIKRIFKDVKNIEYSATVERMTWEDAMWNYGNDKPDIRFGMKIHTLKKPSTVYFNKQDHSGLINGANFAVFDGAESVLAISVSGGAAYTRKQLDELTEWVKRPQIGMKGMAYIRFNEDGTIKSSIDKFYSEERLKKIVETTASNKGDIILMLAGAEERTRKAMKIGRAHV